MEPFLEEPIAVLEQKNIGIDTYYLGTAVLSGRLYNYYRNS